MEHVPCILEVQPVLKGEDVAPRAAPSYQGIEPAHFLHAVDFAVGETYARILLMKTSADGGEVRISKRPELSVPTFTP